MTVATDPAFRFDGKNTSAQKTAARQAARMVTQISKETEQALRGVITRSIREGIPPYDAARMIRSLVGMTAPQSQAAMNYRAELIDSGLTLERVNALTDRYVEKKIAERSETIARTEIMDALNAGSQEAWEQAQAEGLLGETAKKEWITTPDEATCEVCAPMDGVQVALDGDFQTPDGPMSSPPAHPNCRCTAAAVP